MGGTIHPCRHTSRSFSPTSTSECNRRETTLARKRSIPWRSRANRKSQAANPTRRTGGNDAANLTASTPNAESTQRKMPRRKTLQKYPLLLLREQVTQGIKTKTANINFYPYIYVKRLVAFFAFVLSLYIFVFYFPNALGEPDDYLETDPESNLP